MNNYSSHYYLEAIIIRMVKTINMNGWRPADTPNPWCCNNDAHTPALLVKQLALLIKFQTHHRLQVHRILAPKLLDPEGHHFNPDIHVVSEVAQHPETLVEEVVFRPRLIQDPHGVNPIPPLLGCQVLKPSEVFLLLGRQFTLNLHQIGLDGSEIRCPPVWYGEYASFKIFHYGVHIASWWFFFARIRNQLAMLTAKSVGSKTQCMHLCAGAVCPFGAGHDLTSLHNRPAICMWSQWWNFHHLEIQEKTG